MTGMLRDHELQTSYDRDGYVVIDLLTPSEVAQRRRVYEAKFRPEEVAFGIHSVREHHPESQPVIEAALEELLDRPFHETFDAHLLIGDFLVKRSDPNGLLPPHQDVTIVDESGSIPAAIVWVALEDVGRTSGIMGFLPGSHRYFQDVRS